MADRTFHTAEAMLLSNLNTWMHRDDPDGFTPTTRIQAIRGQGEE